MNFNLNYHHHLQEDQDRPFLGGGGCASKTAISGQSPVFNKYGFLDVFFVVRLVKAEASRDKGLLKQFLPLEQRRFLENGCALALASSLATAFPFSPGDPFRTSSSLIFAL